MEIKTNTYHIVYDKSKQTVFFRGTLRLNGTKEYTLISELLNRVIETKPETIILNLKELDFLNSSGINILSKFVINVRKQQNVKMSVIGSEEIPWQSKSLKNLQRLMPSLILDLD
ncbi:STAS domain-containing protein [Myxosarcina sp. GI1]|uniref:slr1659 superfamily regulator n=1 Tax=Myxosarcina sp. GI1 TaxID=1541065 RepID=UPI00056249F1|nr:STAS domain-containing protein [Myxosarcina sp. GI1]